MTDFDRAYQIFSRACDLPRSARDSYVQEACGSNLQLREHVESLLSIDQKSHLALDQIDGGGAAKVLADDVRDHSLAAESARFAMPSRIGRYAVIDELGRGGMGVVYEAEQENPRRRVALKVVRLGVDCEELIARFRQEAHVLGHLRHAGIAQVFEAGTERIGHTDFPYFAMELINGEALDVYAESLSPSERVELLARVCDAVHHAHQKGIIHRDLKPANIMVALDSDTETGLESTVTSIDSIGQPKVMDFGIARLTDADIQLTAMQTHEGQIVGTLAYMSPEQSRGDSSALDIRCDVYALGVILYEMLVGRAPHDLRGKPLVEAARIIQEEEPRSLGACDRRFRGDLETIVGKAMEKDADRRYASAGELAIDLRRYLRDEPILARPSSAFYQVKKFARRHRGLVGMALGSTCALLILLVAMVFQTFEARHQRNLARLERQEAVDSNRRLQRLLDFQTAMLGEVDPQVLGMQIMAQVQGELDGFSGDSAQRQARANSWQQVSAAINATNLGRSTLNAGILAPAVAEIDKVFAKEPVLKASLRSSMGTTFGKLGSRDDSFAHHDQAFSLRLEHLGTMHPETLRSRRDRAYAQATLGEYRAALAELEETLDLQRRALGPMHVDVADTLTSLGDVNAALRRQPEATAAYEEAIRVSREIRGADAFETMLAEYGFAKFLHDNFKHDNALRLVQRLLPLLDGRQDTQSLDLSYQVQTLLGGIYESLGDPEQAMVYRRLAYEGSQVLLGDDHPKTMLALREVAFGYYNAGQVKKSAEVTAELLEGIRRTFGESHPSTLITMLQLSQALLLLEEFEEAESLCRDFLEKSKGVFGASDLKRPGMTLSLVRALHGQGRTEEALRYSEPLVAQMESLDNEPLATGRTLLVHAELLAGLLRFDEANAYFSKALALYEGGLGQTHAETVKTVLNWSSVLSESDQLVDAETHLRSMLDSLRANGDNQVSAVFRVLEHLGENLHDQGRFSDAEPYLREALSLDVASVSSSWRHGRVQCLLGHTLLQKNQIDDGLKQLRLGHEKLEADTDSASEPQYQRFLKKSHSWLESAVAKHEATRHDDSSD